MYKRSCTAAIARNLGRRFAHRIGSAGALYKGCLQVKNARNDLQAVFDAVVDLLEQEVLLPNLRLKYSLGFLKLMLLIQFPQLRKLHKESRTHVATSSLRVLQKQPRQLLVNSQEFTCVFFKSQFGMEHGPIVGSADEGEQPQQMFKTIATENRCKALRARSARAGSTKTRVAAAISQSSDSVSGAGHSLIAGSASATLTKLRSRSQGGGVFKSLIACSTL